MIKAAFGGHAYKLKISSTKSMTGHCVAGGGGIGAIACILAIREGFFPPAINLENTGPECDLDYVPNKARFGVVNAAASGSLGFGGHNDVVIFSRPARAKHPFRGSVPAERGKPTGGWRAALSNASSFGVCYRVADVNPLAGA